MKFRKFSRKRERRPGARLAALIAGIAALALVLFPNAAQAGPTVLPGFDLFETGPGTSFMGVPFLGVPIGSYDFGGGPVSTGTADTIVRRLAPASAPSTTIPIEMVSLQLMSVVPADFGAGPGTYFITLQSARSGSDPPPGPATVGTMTIDFLPAEPLPGAPHGTFDSFFDVFFDIRFGSLSGPIVSSSSLTLTGTDIPWSHFPPAGALEIPGVNTFLNGSDRGADFWPTQGVIEVHPGVGVHVANPARPAVPEFGTVASLGGLLGLGLIGAARRRRPRG